MKHFFLTIALLGSSLSFVYQLPKPLQAAETQTHKQYFADTIPTPGKVGTSDGDRPTQQIRPTSGLDVILNGLWNRFMRIFYMIVGIYGVITLTSAALKYGSARGDVKKVAEARAAIVQTILGIALLIASSVVVSLIWAFTRSFA